MKIAIIGTRGFPGVQGGVETHCQNLSMNLVTADCEIYVFTRKPYVDVSLKNYKGVTLIPVATLKQKHLEAITHTFLSILHCLKLRPDIIHVHGIGPSLLIPLAKALGFKIVTTTHGSNYKHKKWGALAKLILRAGELVMAIFSDKIIAVSENIKTEMKDKYRKDAFMICNGVEVPDIGDDHSILRKFGLEKSTYLLAVGRLVPEKGFDLLIESMEKLNNKKIKLVIAGDDDHKSKYSKALKKKAEGKAHINFTGYLKRENLWILYKKAALFVMPSFYEGHPISLLEALCCGTPYIVSKIKAVENMGLNDDRMFEVGNVDMLTEKISQYVHVGIDAAEREKISDLMAENYNWEKIAEQTRRVYRECCSI